MAKQRRISAVVALACGLTAAACKTSESSSSTTTATSSPTTPTPTPSPGGASQTVSLDLPVAVGDTAANAYGIWPFGVHGSSHALDGHPGVDVEFRPGAQVRAAMDGTVQNVLADIQTPGRFTIRLDHTIGQTHYATDYTNVTNVAAGIAAGATVARGQPLGDAGIQTQFIGTTQIAWAMTHFQFNDFSKTEGLTNPNAVSPESYLSAGAAALFEAIWRSAAYQTEWCEPFPTNARAAGFPMARTWTRQTGSLPERLDVRCPSDGADFEYTLRAPDGSTVEAGVLKVDANARPLAKLELRAASGSVRLGVYDIVSASLTVNLGAPGGSRPTSLDGASTYSTGR